MQEQERKPAAPFSIRPHRTVRATFEAHGSPVVCPPWTRRMLAHHPDAANEVLYEFNAVGYAIHSWQLGTLRIPLQHGGALSKEDQQHILRITNNNHRFIN
jgi:hypothetical protein